MNIRFTFKRLESTEAIKNHAQKKFEKVVRVVPSAFDVQFVFEVNKQEHKAELSFHSGRGKFFSHHSSENLYSSIDVAVGKILHQIAKEKDKHASH